jgi:transposase
LSIDEVALSKGELYTFVTNKKGCGKRGTIVAVISGTKADDIQRVLEKIDLSSRNLVREVTLDMANNMETAVIKSFPNATLVTDRFHVVKLSLDALQHIRIKFRWEAMDLENIKLTNVKNAKKELEKGLKNCVNDAEMLKKLQEAYKDALKENQLTIYENGDTPKQLLARSRYILAKKEYQWTENQTERANILFREYPALETAYHEVLAFRNIYEEKSREQAKMKLEKWLTKIHDNEMEDFYSVANTVQNNFENILNFFNHRHTNANAESFNSKIKLFRANQRGVKDTKFFLFRLSKLFA